MRYVVLLLVALAASMPASAYAQGGPGPGPPPDGDPGAEPAEEPEKTEPPPGGMVTLNTRKDQVTLTDGKVVEGSIVAAGRRAIVIVTAEGEKTIPRDKVQRIERAPTRVDALRHHLFETLVVDGHEHIIVPPGLEEETEAGPPGIFVPIVKPGEKATARARYELKKGSVIHGVLDIATKHTEDLQGEERTLREETVRAAVTQTVTGVTADGTWSVEAAYSVTRFLRDGKNVRATEGQAITPARVLRSLSPAGLWQPGAETLTDVGKNADLLKGWLGYFTVPLPAQPVALGTELKLDKVIPTEIGNGMLTPPAHVRVPNWRVSGTYKVTGTGEYRGANCLMIAIELEGVGSGDGQYGNQKAVVDIKGRSRWDVYFSLDEGRLVECSVSAALLTTGTIGDKAVRCKTEVVAKAAVNKVTAPAKPDVGKAPEVKKGPGLNKDLDDLMKQLNDPGFFKD